MAAVRITTVTIEEIDTENIAEAVRQSGIRFTTLSERIGQHEQYVSRLCRGLIKEVPLEVFNRLAQEMVGFGAFKSGSKADVLAVMRGEKVAETVFRPRLVQGGNEPELEVIEGRERFESHATPKHPKVNPSVQQQTLSPAA